MRYQTRYNTLRQPRTLEIPDRGTYLRNLREDFSKKKRRLPKPPPLDKFIKKMWITRRAYQEIKNTIGSRAAESGGILLSNTLDYTITGFIFDIAAAKSRSIYQPDTDFLNSVLKGRNEEFVGVAHSHQKGGRQLSQQDQNAAWSNMTSPGNPHLNAYLMPLVQTIPDTGRFEVIPYILTCHPSGSGRVIVHRVELKIIEY